MPIYEYQCNNCGETFTKIFLSPDERPEEMVCPECESTDVQQVFSPPSVHSTGGGEEIEETEESQSQEGGQLSGPGRGQPLAGQGGGLKKP